MEYVYKTKGVCSRTITIELDGDTVKHIEFLGGCPGNALGVACLVKDKHIDEVITLLKGIRCGDRSTSCPDQLAIALEEARSN